MAAPSGIVWGSIVNSYGRIGIYKSLSTTNTQATLTVQIWFWSKYSVSDTANTLYYTNSSSSSSATDSKGAVTVKTTYNSGSGWDTSNQVKLYEYTHSAYTRGTSASTRYLYAKLTDVDRVGGTMYASTTVSVPKLASYTVSYNANGGSGAPSSQTKWYGKTLTLSSTKPTRTGYSFQGWATSASGSKAYSAGGSYTANAAVTLYAVWKANTYTVSYNANGGSGAPSAQTKTYGVTLTLSSTKPTRTNYNFKGWGTSASTTTVSYAAGGSYTANSNITLYAIWEIAYVKPRITGYSVTRCDSSGTASDDGTYALVKFNWACDLTVSSITLWWRLASSTTASSTTVTATGTSGTVSQIIGDGGISADYTYVVSATVADASGNSTSTTNLQGTAFPIDVYKDGTGIAFGKPAETSGLMDVNFTGRFRKGYYVHYTRGEYGVAGYARICTFTISGTYANAPIEMRIVDRAYLTDYKILFSNTADADPTLGGFSYEGNRPGYMVKTATSTWDFYVQKSGAYGDLTVTSFDMPLYMTSRVTVTWQTDQVTSLPSGYTTSSVYRKYRMSIVPNDVGIIYGTDTSGGVREVMNPVSVNNNLVLGYDLYENKIGNTHIYGHDIMHYVSNVANPGGYRPYRRQGDVLELYIRTAGYVTNSGKEVHFFIPFAEPIIGSPTVTVATGNGFILRQGGNYTHGSAASTYAKPTSYTAGRYMNHGVNVVATFSSTTNATNNAPIGIFWDGTITLS